MSLHSRRARWIGSLSLCVLACASSDEGGPGAPPFGPEDGLFAGGNESEEPNGAQQQEQGGDPGDDESPGTPNSEATTATGSLMGSPGDESSASEAEDGSNADDVGEPSADDPGMEPSEDTVDPVEDPGTEGSPAEGPGQGPVIAPGPSGLPAPPGPDNLTPPVGAPGGLSVLSWAGFQAAVTYSFDDNNNSQIQNYDAMQALGVPFTFYLWTNQGSAQNPVWSRALADGHEIGNHTLSHNPGVCTPQDINSATQFIQTNVGATPYTMAAPNGNGCYSSAANGLFFINRGVQPAQPVLPNGNSNPLNLNCYIPATNQQAGVFNNQLDGGRNAGGWVIYVIHGFNGDGFQPIQLNQFQAAVNYAKSVGDVWIGTMVDIGAYWLGQRAFTQAMTTQNGNETTWTWNLPGQFPPGKYLRVSVDGGTLSQNGTPLSFDPHGYYEVALDEGTLTLSP